MAGWTGKRVNVAYSKPEEPAFLRRFKERVGYKDDDGLSDKFSAMPQATDDDLEDGEDELPQVVSLKSGDLTQEEYNQLRSEGKLDKLLQSEEGEMQGPKPRDEAEDPPPDGKIIFRKPTKRSVDDKEGKGSEKRAKGDDKSERKDKKQKKKELQKIKLLSFNEDEEEDE